MWALRTRFFGFFMKETTKQTYLIFWQHLRRYRGQFWLTVGAIILATLVQVITPLYYKKFFDTLALSQQIGVNSAGVQLVNIILTILALNGIIWVAYRLATYVNNNFQLRVMSDLYNTCFEYLHEHSFGFFINRFVGSLVRKVGRLVRGFEDIGDSFYWNLLRMVVSIVAVLIVVFYKYPILGFVMLGWLVFYMVINYWLAIYKFKFDEAAAASDTRVTGNLADTITNQANVKVFTALPFELSFFKDLTKEQFLLRKRSWDFDALVESMQAGFMFILEFLIFYIAIKLWQRGTVTVGDFVLLQVYIINLFDMLWNFGRIIRRIYRSLADAEEMVEILATPHEVQDLPQAKPLAVSRGEVEFKDINFTYQGGRDVIKNFSLKVKPGEKVGVVGPSGAGKTTLIALIFRFYNIAKGVVYIDGQNISEVTQESLRRQISLVSQDPILFHRNLMDNIRYGNRDATDAEVLNAAKLAHCDEFINQLPDGYNTMVGERGIKLSGGERQRVAIARAILKNAPILVLDEATSSLDSRAELLIQKALTELMKGRTTIVIAHRLSTIMKMDRIVVLRNGELYEIGSHDDLLKNKSGLYKELWQLQAGGFLVS